MRCPANAAAAVNLPPATDCPLRVERTDYDCRSMPQLTVEGFTSVEVENGTRLVLAIEGAGVDILHACGGNARCTTCRVEFISGEPETMTVAERNVLAAKGVTGVRLSCQILCDHDMTVRAISRLAGTGRPDPGGTPTPEIAPPPEWIPKES
jgi:ferredoxin